MQNWYDDIAQYRVLTSGGKNGWSWMPTSTVRSVAVIGWLAAEPNLGDLGSSQVHPPSVVTLLHGAIVMIPTFTYSMGWTAQPDPAWYRLIWWGLGHQSQQINVCATP